MMTMTLLEMAKKMDRLDPETAWKERLDLGEQMKAQLGARYAAFERYHDVLLAPSRVEITGRKEGDHAMFNIPGGPIQEIVLTAEGTEAKIKLTSLFHGSKNLLGKKQREGVPVPGRLELGLDFSDGAETVLAFQSEGPGSVDVLFVRSDLAAAALRLLAAHVAEPTPEASQETARAPEAAAEGTGDNALLRVEKRVRLAREAAEKASDRIVRSAVIAQLDLVLKEIAMLREDDGPAKMAAEPDPPPESAPLTEEQRIAQAADAYRAWRTLSLAPQVGADELAKASLAWTTARDTFEEGSAAAARLQVATAEIDREIDEERQRPARYPNQLPGAIPVRKESR